MQRKVQRTQASRCRQPQHSTCLTDSAAACVIVGAYEAGWAENYDREWDMLTNCISMAIEEERIIKLKIEKLQEDLQILKLEVSGGHSRVPILLRTVLLLVSMLRYWD